MPISNLKGKAESVPVRKYAIDDFSGGLDIKSDPERLDSRYLLQATNVDLSSGKAAARGGLTGYTAGFTAGLNYLYHSPVLGNIFAVGEFNPARIFKTATPESGAWTDVSAGAPDLSGGSDCVEFNGLLVFATVNGVYTFDGTATWTLRAPAVTGTSIAVWQNKLWVAGVGSRVWFSNAGSYDTWAALDYADVREGTGDAPCLGLHVTQNQDTQGRPALIVTKRRSVHRIHDPTTGAFTTLSADTGPYAKRAIVSGGAKTLFIADDGIYMTDGFGPPVVISQRVRPLFWPSDIGNPTGVQPASVFHNGQFTLSFPGYSTITNQHYLGTGAVVHVIYDPQTDTFSYGRWPAVNANAANGKGAVHSWLSVKSGTLAGNLYALVNDLTPNKCIFKFNTNTNDDGTVNTAILQTPYMELAGGTKFRIHRLRMFGRLAGLAVGTPFTLRVRKDGSVTDSIVRTLTVDRSTALDVQAYDFNRLGDARSISFVFELPIVAATVGYTSDNQYIKVPEKNQIDGLLIEYTPTGRN